MITVAYYTIGTLYEQEVSRLVGTLRRVGMPHLIFPCPDRGDWHKNTAMKAEVISLVRKRIRGPFVYVDADAVVHENCDEYFESLECDFAAHWFKGRVLLSGTMFFADNDRVDRLIQAWLKKNKETTIGGGQANLQVVLTDELQQERLPGRYCYIFDANYGEERPIIEHLQASREWRSPRLLKGRRRRIDEIEHCHSERR